MDAIIDKLLDKYADKVLEVRRLEDTVNLLEKQNKDLRMRLEAIAYRYDEHSAPNEFLQLVVDKFKEGDR